MSVPLSVMFLVIIVREEGCVTYSVNGVEEVHYAEEGQKPQI